METVNVKMPASLLITGLARFANENGLVLEANEKGQYSLIPYSQAIADKVKRQAKSADVVQLNAFRKSGYIGPTTTPPSAA